MRRGLSRHPLWCLLLSGAAATAMMTSCSAPSSLPTATASAQPPDVDIAELDARSLTVQPFADFVMSSGDLVWVSGAAPGIVAYDQDMNAVFSVEAGVVSAALEFGHDAIWASEAQPGQRSTTLLKIDAGTGAATRFPIPEPGIPAESSIAVTDDAVWVIVPLSATNETWMLVGLDPDSGR